MIRWLLAIVFFYSGVSKLIDPKAFAAIIDTYGLIPETWVMPVAVLLPLLEAVTTAALLFQSQIIALSSLARLRLRHLNPHRLDIIFDLEMELWDACGSLEIITGLRLVFLAIPEYGIQMGWMRIMGVLGRMIRNIGGSAVFGRPLTWTCDGCGYRLFIFMAVLAKT